MTAAVRTPEMDARGFARTAAEEYHHHPGECNLPRFSGITGLSKKTRHDQREAVMDGGGQTARHPRINTIWIPQAVLTTSCVTLHADSTWLQYTFTANTVHHALPFKETRFE